MECRLRTIRQPNTYGYTIDCQRYELHAQIVARVFGDGWWVPDEDTVRILEPIFESIVRGASAGSQEYSQMHNVVMEKYSYDRTNKTITSCTCRNTPIPEVLPPFYSQD